MDFKDMSDEYIEQNLLESHKISNNIRNIIEDTVIDTLNSISDYIPDDLYKKLKSNLFAMEYDVLDELNKI